MTVDVLADADEVAARAAKAAGVVVRELESLAELEAMTALFDEIWEPDAGNPSMRLDLLRAMTKAGNYAYRRLTTRRVARCSGRASVSSGRPPARSCTATSRGWCPPGSAGPWGSR